MITSTAINRINPPTLFDSSAFGFSQVVTAPAQSKLVFVSGQFGGDTTGTVISDDTEQQIIQAFANLRAAIDAAGARPEDVLKIVVLIVDHTEDLLGALEREVRSLFGDHLPASTLIPVPRLALDTMKFEIDATLVVQS